MKSQPITIREKVFVNLIILHLATVLYAVKKGVVPEAAGQDIELRELFSHPIFHGVWAESKNLRDPEMVRYIEGLLSEQKYKSLNAFKPLFRQCHP